MSLVGNPRRNARKCNPPATRRRALELLATSRDGCNRSDYVVEMLVDLVRAGLATAKAERVVATGRTNERDHHDNDITPKPLARAVRASYVKPCAIYAPRV
jgi:hypothetical protein